MPREKKKILKEKFESQRPSAHQFALKAEAERLNCDISDVRPSRLVLSLEPGYDPKFILAALPDEILVKTMGHLDSLDFFKMTLVCKKWKSLVYDNCAELKRAEHAVTTHLITFTDWMDPSKTPSCENFLRQYCHFSWGLVRWCCEISNNLETLILDHSVSYPNVVTLLQLCPNLKNLQFGHISAFRDSSLSGLLSQEVHLSKLEVFLCGQNPHILRGLQLKRAILCSAERIRVLRAAIENEDMEDIQFFRPMTDVFRHLIALDLTSFSDNVLEILTSTPNLQLKYLRLGDVPAIYSFPEDEHYLVVARYRDLFHQLVSKLRQLEVLETWSVPGVTNKTIQLLTDLDLDLKFVVLVHSAAERVFVSDEHARELLEETLDPSLLIEFRDKLLFRNPELVLSDFHFIVETNAARDKLLEEGIGFTFKTISSMPRGDYASGGLCYPSMRNRLNINF